MWLVGLAGALLSLALGSWGLGEGSLWLDEVFTVVDARQTPWQLLSGQLTRPNPHPPLYYLVVQAAGSLCGTSEACLRAPSVIAAAMTTLGITLVAGRLFGPWAASATTVLAATLPFGLKYAQQARHYSLLALLTTVALLLTVRAVDLDGRGRARPIVYVALGLVAGAATWTQVFALAFLPGLGLWCLGWRHFGSPHAATARLRDLGLAVAVWGLACLPLVVRWAANGDADGAAAFASKFGPVPNAKALFLQLGALGTDNPWIGTWLIPAWLVLDGRRRDLHLSLVALAFAPLLVIVVRNPTHFVTLRYFMPSVVVMTCCIGAGWAALATWVARVGARWIRPRALAAVLGLAVAAVAAWPMARSFDRGIRKHYAIAGFEPWREVAAFVNHHGTRADRLIAVPHDIMRYPFVVYPVVAPTIAGGDAELTTGALTAPRVFVISSHIDGGERRAERDGVLRHLARLGYARDRTLRPPANRHIQVLVFRRRG